MSEEKEKRIYLEDGGYQAKIDKPPGKLPTWGSSVKKPPSSEKKPNN